MSGVDRAVKQAIPVIDDFLKGDGRPLVPATERARLLAALRPVDHVVVFDEDTPEAVLERVRPDVHTKGADYAPPDATTPDTT